MRLIGCPPPPPAPRSSPPAHGVHLPPGAHLHAPRSTPRARGRVRGCGGVHRGQAGRVQRPPRPPPFTVLLQPRVVAAQRRAVRRLRRYRIDRHITVSVGPAVLRVRSPHRRTHPRGRRAAPPTAAAAAATAAGCCSPCTMECGAEERGGGHGGGHGHVVVMRSLVRLPLVQLLLLVRGLLLRLIRLLQVVRRLVRGLLLVLLLLLVRGLLLLLIGLLQVVLLLLLVQVLVLV